MIIKLHTNTQRIIESTQKNILGQITRQVTIHHSYNIVCYKNWFALLFGKKWYVVFNDIYDGRLSEPPHYIKLTRQKYQANVFKDKEFVEKLINDIHENPNNYLVR